MNNNSDNKINSILVVEDNEGLNKLICKKLRKAGFNVYSILVGKDAIEFIKNNNNFLILLDYSLPDMTGKELIEALLEEGIAIPPFVFITGQGYEKLAVELLQFGARDYIVKDGNFIDILVGNIKKIAEQIDNENELKRSRDQISYLASLVEKVSDVIISTEYENEQFWIKSWNKAAKKVYGWEEHEVVGKNINKIIPTTYTKTNNKIVKQTLINEGVWKGDIVQYHKSGREIYLSSSATVLKKSDGTLSGAVIVNHDITNRIIANNVLKESERNLKKSIAAKDKFFSIIAHDLKSPFNSILGFSELLASDSNSFDDDDIKKISSTIYNESKSFYKLLENLLEWARSQRQAIMLKKKVLSAKKLIEESISILNSNVIHKEIELNYYSQNSESFFADEHTIKTVIRNLIDNAIKFTNRKGKININSKQENNSVVISISDTGTGISSKHINKLFSFENGISSNGTENEQGTGLGLLVCKEFIELNGGSIHVKSEVNVGTEFIIKIPIF
ncbi:MAG: response regulator [Bacteroidetes bacterium]|jgi:two-component system, sensor histidine kinase and response regulator|nr:response regulator [Bacteroidota bacterium]MBT6687680.1 response regulator [Bacteroidota bacterium]MBT7142500.1 response regulator [Bacteroidota bacterium]MBT7493449.1 response regulator [Bacteroidota bacterium]